MWWPKCDILNVMWWPECDILNVRWWPKYAIFYYSVTAYFLKKDCCYDCCYDGCYGYLCCYCLQGEVPPEFAYNCGCYLCLLLYAGARFPGVLLEKVGHMLHVVYLSILSSDLSLWGKQGKFHFSIAKTKDLFKCLGPVVGCTYKYEENNETATMKKKIKVKDKRTDKIRKKNLHNDGRLLSLTLKL